MRWWLRLLRRTKEPRPASFNIYVKDDGFDIVVLAELPATNKVKWSDIKKIEAFRSDDSPGDTVCLRFTLYWGRPPINICEGDPGFGDIPAAISSAFPDIPDGWLGEMQLPVGFSDHRVVYVADEHVQDVV